MTTPASLMQELQGVINKVKKQADYIPQGRCIAYVASKMIYLMRVSGVFNVPSPKRGAGTGATP